MFAAPASHKDIQNSAIIDDVGGLAAIERALDGLSFATFVLESVAANGCIGGGNNCDLKVGCVWYFI